MEVIKRLKRWYSGSSLEMYVNKTESFHVKGDFAGLWYTFFYAFLEWFIYTFFPVNVFIITLFILTLNPLVLVSICFVFISIPQIFYFWNERWKNYLEVTKELRKSE